MAAIDGTASPRPAKRQRKVSFSADAAKDPNSCITIRYVSSIQDMQSGEENISEFSPDFAERFFNEDGGIVGFKDLKIVVWLHALSFHVHVEISYMEVMQAKKNGKEQVSDLLKVFKEIFGVGLIEDRAVFLQLLASYEDFSGLLHQHGRKIASWSLAEDQSWIKGENDASDVAKEIWLLEDLTGEELQDWHARLTPLALLFIEGATSVDPRDPRWEVHILVLPPFRGNQNGFHLLEAVYKTAVDRDSFEVTMEEPSSDLQELRESMDTILLLSSDSVRAKLRTALSTLKSASSTTGGGILNFQECMPSPYLAKIVREKFKICKSQLHSCWQVLIYLHVMGEGKGEVLSLFQDLLAWSLKLEVYGTSKSADVGKNKVLLDVENEFDSSRTFVMFKAKPSPVKGGNDVLKATVLEAEESLEAVDMDPEANSQTAFLELLKDREEEIQQIAEKVIQHLKGAGMSLVSTSQV